MSALCLNREQQEVVDHDGHCLVVACPGSGKTRVIIEKIAHILSSDPKARLCAVTFTRDAAIELKKRLAQKTDKQVIRGRTQVGTFHSLAIRQLRSTGNLGKVATPAEQAAFVYRACRVAEDEVPYEEAVRIIETVKSSRTTVPEEDSPVYQAYAAILRQAQVDDLYDVLKRSLIMMQQGEVPPYPVEYMLVDEFQDTDEIQLAWVLEHVKGGTKVTVVGDDDQSVYSFRRALGYAGMERFRAATNAQLIALGTNYRCLAEILSAGHALIRCNSERIQKSLVAARGPGGSVTSTRCTTRTEEAEAVVERIWSDVVALPDNRRFQYTVPEGKWAVLARNRRTLDCVEHALNERRIRYIRPPSDSIWNRTPFVQFIALLRSVQTGAVDGIDQTLSFSGLDQDQLNAVHQGLQGTFWRLIDGELPALDDLPDDAWKTLKDFARKASGWRNAVRGGNYNLAIEGVAQWFEDHLRDPDDLELLADLKASVCRLNGSLAQRANSLTLPDDNDSGTSGVALMTMHGSKGLEFDNVWIFAAEDGVIPSKKNPVYDEERRLMYVGMTRAKDALFMSSRVSAMPSPFVIESGHDPRLSN